MAVLTDFEVRRAASEVRTREFATADSVLRESRNTRQAAFDIFLCHAKLDAELVLGVKAILERTGQTVYVDWIDDPLLDRSKVTPVTADQLRKRMRQCASLIYVYTRNATGSRWMPWELGYFDGHNGNVAVLPIVQSSSDAPFKGEEFVGLYPYVDVSANSLWVHRSTSEYVPLRTWRGQADKMRPTA